MKTIDWTKYVTDKGTKHSYIPLYQALLSGVSSEDTIIEIGVKRGGSLLAFRDMLGCQVIGIDIISMPKCLKNQAGIRYLKMDAYKQDLEIMGCLAIIDDGSHDPKDQLYVGQTYHKYLKSGGLLIIEDVKSLEIAKGIVKGLPRHVYQMTAIIDLRQNRGKKDDIVILGIKI